MMMMVMIFNDDDVELDDVLMGGLKCM